MVDEPNKESEKEKKAFNIVNIDGINYPIYKVKWESIGDASINYKVHHDFGPKLVSPMSIYAKAPEANDGGSCVGHSIIEVCELKSEEEFVNALLLGTPVTMPRRSYENSWSSWSSNRTCAHCLDREFWSKGCYITIYERICTDCVKLCFEKGISIRMILANRFVICRKLRKGT